MKGIRPIFTFFLYLIWIFVYKECTSLTSSYEHPKQTNNFIKPKYASFTNRDANIKKQINDLNEQNINLAERNAKFVILENTNLAKILKSNLTGRNVNLSERNAKLAKQSGELLTTQMKDTKENRDNFTDDVSPVKRELVPLRSCDEWQKVNDRSGIRPLLTDYDNLILFANCDQYTHGGGWTVFQRRYDGSVNFYRPWEEYERGFGGRHGELWLGLENVHRITRDGRRYELMIEMTQGYWTFVAIYDWFRLSSASDNYRISFNGYTSNGVVNSFAQSNGMQFSTYDRDNDEDDWFNCARTFKGAWWYSKRSNIRFTNLNGRYKDPRFSGIWWTGITYTVDYSFLNRTEMKFRLKK